MTQQLSQTDQNQKNLWVLISTTKENTDKEILEKITPSVIDLVDEWQSGGRFLWSGPFNDNKTAMAVFEGTEDEANQLYQKYGKICGNLLNYDLYKWDAIPLLSLL
ncbi:MAG: hypothetical protein ACT4N5_07165 [Nitrosopumilaceae archaeon]